MSIIYYSTFRPLSPDCAYELMRTGYMRQDFLVLSFDGPDVLRWKLHCDFKLVEKLRRISSVIPQSWYGVSTPHSYLHINYGKTGCYSQHPRHTPLRIPSIPRRDSRQIFQGGVR